MLKRYIEYIKEGEMAPGGGRLPHFRILPNFKQQKPLEKIPDLTPEEQKICDEALEFFKPVIEWNKNHAYGANRNSIDLLPILFGHGGGITPPTNILTGMIDYNTRDTEVSSATEITQHNIKVGSYKRLIEFYDKTKDKIKFPKNFEQILDLTTYLDDNLESYKLGYKSITYSSSDLSNPILLLTMSPNFNQEGEDDGYYSTNLNLNDLTIISSEIKKIASKYRMIKCEVFQESDGGAGYQFEFEIL